MRQIKLDPDLCECCNSCYIACVVEHSISKDLNQAFHEKPTPTSGLRIKIRNNKPQLVQCRNCKKPRCIEVCETGAIYKKGKYVLIDYNRCDGCWKCIDVCSYSAIWKNKETNTVVKCELCIDSIEPACVTACPTKALKITEDDEDQE